MYICHVTFFCFLQDGKDRYKDKKTPVNLDVTNSLPVDDILPKTCGTIDEELKYMAPDLTPKVVNGQDIIKGTIPWQVGFIKFLNVIRKYKNCLT